MSFSGLDPLILLLHNLDNDFSVLIITPGIRVRDYLNAKCWDLLNITVSNNTFYISDIEGANLIIELPDALSHRSEDYVKNFNNCTKEMVVYDI